MNAGEQQLVDAYRTIESALRDSRADLAPFAERNATKALAALWQVMNGLDQDPGQVYDLGA